MKLESSIELPFTPVGFGQVGRIPNSTLEKWQSIVDTMAELVNVPAGLIMQINGADIECLIASRTPGNPYHPGDSEHLFGSGLYCETVINSRNRLLVPNALKDPHWQNNPDVKLNMISYLGFPLLWPDGRPFGTICVLDCKGNSYSDLYKRLIEQFRDLIEHHLALIDRETRLEEALAAGAVMAFDWDLSTDLVRRSNNTAQILGLDPQQTLDGKSFLARVHRDDLARLKAVWSTLKGDNSKYSIAYRFLRLDGREVWLQETSKAEYDATGRLVRVKGLALDMTERKHAEERQKILTAELDHRVKNMLARVAAVAQSTSHDSGSIGEFLRTYHGRIQSMAAAHTVLIQTGWHGADLTTVVRSQLAPYATDTNTTIVGTDVMLSSSATQALAMVLQELVTNAVKYGALSIPGGRVSVSWDRRLNGGAATNLIFVWRELDGPPVAATVRSGYGTSLIRELIPHELGGNVDLVFGSDGACCRIEFPLEGVKTPIQQA